MTDEKNNRSEETDANSGVETQKEEDEQELTDQSDDRNVIHPSAFPTLELTLSEARHQYEEEEVRREAVESKIGTVVTVDALVISFGALFATDIPPFVLVIVLLPALVAAGLGLYAIRTRRYQQPGKRIIDFHDYSKYDDVDLQRERLLRDYEVATWKNKQINDPKYTIFNICIMLTFLSILLIFVLPIADHFNMF